MLKCPAGITVHNGKVEIAIQNHVVQAMVSHYAKQQAKVRKAVRASILRQIRKSDEANEAKRLARQLNLFQA